MTDDSNRRVAIVEDEVSIALDLQVRVERLGHTVTVNVSSAREAFDAFANEAPDLVLMDIVLKGEMDGIEAAEIIRSRWGIPVVFVTAYADSQRLRRARLALPFGYLVKPIHDRDLKVTIETALYVAAAQEELLRNKELTSIRLRLFELAHESSLDELLTTALDEAERVTQSEIGFLHFVESDQRTLSLQTWSTRTRQLCSAPGAGTRFDIDCAGVWVDCVRERRPVIHNDYDSLPHKTGFPEGHVAVVRELVVPILRNDRVVAILGVGNKGTDYTQEDVATTSDLANVAWEIASRKRSEEALKSAQARTAAILEGIADTFYSVDGHWRFVTVNPAAERAPFGRPASELVGKVIWDLYPELAGTQIQQHYVDAARDQSLHHYEAQSPLNRRWYEVFMQGWEGGVDVYMRDITERKSAEERARESTQRLSLALRSGRLGVWDWNVQTNDMLWDDEMLRMYGITREQFSGGVEDWKLGLHPDDRDRAIAECEAALAGTSEFDTHFRLLWPNGRVRFIKADGLVLRDEGGAPVRMLGINRDITSERQAEQSYQMLFSEMLNGFALHEIICDAGGRPVDYRFLEVNPAWERLTGIAADHVVGRTVLEVLPGTERYWIEVYGRVALTGEPDVFEQYSGELERYFEVAAFRPAPRQFACVFNDVTDRKRAQEADRLSTKRLESALALQKMWVSSEAEVADFALTACMEITGSEFGFLGFMDAGEQVMTIHAWSDSAMEACAIVDRPLEFRIDETGLWGDAVRKRSPIIVNDYTAPLASKRGTPDGHVPIRRYLGIPVLEDDRIVAVGGLANKTQPYTEHDAHNVALLLQDMWQQIQMHRERRQLERIEALMRRAQHMESLGVLAGGVAHDFNNMLGAITGYADLALEEAEPGSEIRTYMEQLLTAAARAAEMVQQILAFSRQAESERKIVDVGSVVKETIKLLRGMLPSTIELRYEIAPGIPPVLADATQIQQVIMNLCTNANHAMSDGGQLSLSLTTDRITQMQSSDVLEIIPGDHVHLAVRDTGTGMPPDVVERAFEPFFSTKEKGKGSGMGLATSHGIVASHGGFMTVESEPGEGSVFHVFLPCTSEVAGDVAEEDIPAVLMGHERVLLVDDEPVVLEMTSAILRNLGYSVSTYPDGGTAMAALEAAPDRWDVVVTDQTMPKLDGVEILRGARRLRSDLPVVIMTGHSEKLNGKSDGGVGADGILRKPFRRSILAATLRQVLDGSARRT